ncbi:MAG: putative sugar nucleotidyl transferase [Fidelibacterota bacterium]
MNYILFEDTHSKGLRPFSLTHATFEVRCGIYRNIDRVVNLMNPDDSLTLLVRKELAGVIKERYPEFLVNPDKISPGIWLNGACLWELQHIKSIKRWKQYITNSNHLVGFITDTVQTSGVLPSLDDYKQCKIDIHYLAYLWDAIDLNGKFINNDHLNSSFNNYLNPAEYNIQSKSGNKRNIHPSAILMHKYNIFASNNCEISGGVILDASKGKVVIDEGVKIDIGALIQGPVYIGKDSVVNPGTKIRGHVAIGPVCKIGGEIEDTIIHGYSNKQHDGFLGHSYLGEWVNLGANTTNSNLKNNYGDIRFDFGDVKIQSGRQFLGILMGDYCKSGISTMFNTGTYAGVGANIFGGGFQPKYIPSFSWSPDSKTKFDKFIKTCELVKNRRNMKLSNDEKDLLFELYEGLN